MGQVDVEAGLVLEGHDEAMSKAFGPILGAHVGAPFEIHDGIDLAFEGREFGFQLFDLGGRRFFLELETDNVAEGSGHFFFGGGFFAVMVGKGESGKESGEGNRDEFHAGSVGGKRESL